MTTYEEMFPGRWLTGEGGDIPVAGITLTIKTVALETLEEGSKYVVFFNELPKGLILNKTNCKAIGKLHGRDTSTWVGKQIVLYRTIVQFKLEMVAAIRVRSTDALAEPQAALPLA